MKKLLMAVLAASTLFFLPKKSNSQEISFNTFYSSLSPYGEWVSVGDYGRCWRPVGVAIGWRPYADGHWIWTDYGWTWASDYPWGWAPFHYGRWAFDPEYGWIWIPGYVWAPAWVEWRWGGGYAGWAPMPPGFHFRVDVVVGPEQDDFGVGIASWSFIRANEFGKSRYAYIERERVPRVVGNTRNVTQFRFTSSGVYAMGLPREQVERVVHRRIETIDIVHTTDVHQTRMEGNHYVVYSPAPLTPRVRNEGEEIRKQRDLRPNNTQGSSINNPRTQHPQRVRSNRNPQPTYRSGRPGISRSRQLAPQPKPKENSKARERDSNNNKQGHGRQTQ